MRVSVLINNYNYQQFVGAAVKSVLAQTYRNIECIVVDDGSDDDSLKMLEAFASSVQVVAKANGGQASAYNEGYRRSTGAIVMFLDADDWLLPHAVETVVSAWCPGVAKVQFSLQMVNRCGDPLGRLLPREMSDTAALDLLRKFGAYDSPPGSGNAYDAEFLSKIMPIDEAAWRIAADTVPIMLAPAHGTIISIPHALGVYRLHKSQASSMLMNNAPADVWEEYRRIRRTKAFVAQSLSDLNIAPRVPMLFAPWEARVATLCVRFGDSVADAETHARLKIAWFAFASLWRWPKWTVGRKSIQSLWMALVLLLPGFIAHRLALRHRASAGLPTSTPH